MLGCDWDFCGRDFALSALPVPRALLAFGAATERPASAAEVSRACSSLGGGVLEEVPTGLGRPAVDVAFDRASESHDSFVFMLAVRPKAGGDPLAVSLEVGL